jgi:hypothetical protein
VTCCRHTVGVAGLRLEFGRMHIFDLLLKFFA